MSARPASFPDYLLIDPVRVYGDLDLHARIVVSDVGVLPPAGVYGGLVSIAADVAGAEHGVEVRIVVPPRRDGRYVGCCRVLELLDPVSIGFHGTVGSAVVTFVSVLVATGLPAAAA